VCLQQEYAGRDEDDGRHPHAGQGVLQGDEPYQEHQHRGRPPDDERCRGAQPAPVGQPREDVYAGGGPRDGQDPERVPPKEGLKMLRRIAYRWLILSLAGLALYVAFYAAFHPLYTEGVDTPDLSMFKDKAFVISMSKDKVFAILAVVSFALTISIFLALDNDQVPDGGQLGNMTFAGLGYMLLVRRKPLLAALVLTLVAMGLIVYFIIKSMGVTLEAEGSTLTVKFPWQTIHYIPIHSQVGWQNTGVELEAGRVVKYSIAGAASPGFLQDIDIHSERMREYKLGRITKADFDKNVPRLKWPFRGPEGYRKEGDINAWYKEMAEQDEKDCDLNFAQKQGGSKLSKLVPNWHTT
jgi:hypothetical protein